MARFVALGDSLTEGVGDAHAGFPNGWRGWADLLAAHLARLDPTLHYANLALRAKRAQHVLAEQVDSAVAMDPSLATIRAGGNDVLLPHASIDQVVASLDESIDRLSATGARVLVLNGFDVTVSPLLRYAGERVRVLNDAVGSLARNHDATAVDVSDFRAWSVRPLFGPDRMHPSPLGHRLLARRMCDVLGLPPIWVEDEYAAAPPCRSRRNVWAEELSWWGAHVVPQLHRWATSAAAREGATAKWATLVRPAEWTEAGWSGDRGWAI